MERETIDVKLVTPCFLGGAAQAAEWRVASIRGELRWWFRAVAGEARTWAEVRALEEILFGSIERGGALRLKSRTRLPARHDVRDWPQKRFTAKELAEFCRDPKAEARLHIVHSDQETRSDPIQYLGFGPFSNGRLARSYLPSGAEASLDLLWVRPVEKDLRDLFSKALWAWLYLGGIGSRSRKGFGSLTLVNGGPRTRRDLEEEIAISLPAIKGQSDRLPMWTHFSPLARVFLGTEENLRSWEEAMIRLGAWLIGFRRRYGYPKDDRKLGEVLLANRDYEWAAPRGRHPREGMPDRAGFGLPLPFRRKNRQTEVVSGEDVVWGAGDGDARRASPLLLHVAMLGSTYLPVLTYLPAVLLPGEGRLHFKGHAESSAPTEEQRGIVNHFLDGLADRGLIQEVRR